MSILYIILFILGLVFLAWLWSLVVRRRYVRRLAGRLPVSDEKFAETFFSESEDAGKIAVDVRRLLSSHAANVPHDLIYPDDDLVRDLGADSVDSLAGIAYIMAVEKKFGIKIPEQDMNRILTLRGMAEYLATNA